MNGTQRNYTNLFEIENAKQMSPEQIVKTFVPTSSFRRILSQGHQIITGARGSGKTVLARMLSHSHLAIDRDERSRELVRDRRFIGTYVATNVEWVGSLRSRPWSSEEAAESDFQWKLNIAILSALVETIRSCINTYVVDTEEGLKVEERISDELGRTFLDGANECSTLLHFRYELNKLADRKRLQQREIAFYGEPRSESELIGAKFDDLAILPFLRAVEMIRVYFDIPDDAVWALAIDETEFLEARHHRILNTIMRAHPANFSLKITTQPYCHYTLDTNVGQPVSEFEDFEYIYIDQDPTFSRDGDLGNAVEFAEKIFAQRASASLLRHRGTTLHGLLGSSLLLDPKHDAFEAGGRFWPLLEKYAGSKTIVRARKWYAEDRKIFADSVGRKILPALLLKDAVVNVTGRSQLDVYSGASMVVRCTDCNPRRLVRLLNNMLDESRRISRRRPGKNRGVLPTVPAKTQNRILDSFSTSYFMRLKSELRVGPALHSFLEEVALYMKRDLIEREVRVDQISSIQVASRDADVYWILVTHAVGLGLLYPNMEDRLRDHVPVGEGNFRLGYVLAPTFRLLPRKSKTIALSTIMRHSRARAQIELTLERIA